MVMILPVDVMILCTKTPAFCRQLTGKPPRLGPDGPSLWPEPVDAFWGIMGTGVDWTGRTLATGFSSVRAGGRLSGGMRSLVMAAGAQLLEAELCVSCWTLTSSSG